jgi:6-pyruvoyltetrahydropterin/6-carboxytetrahydropterin synthase
MRLTALEQIRPNKIYRLPYNPTAENMARYLLDEVGPKLIDAIKGYDLAADEGRCMGDGKRIR